jgi:hypothetical protein
MQTLVSSFPRSGFRRRRNRYGEYKRAEYGCIRFCCSAAKTGLHLMRLNINEIFKRRPASAAYNCCMARMACPRATG